MYCFLATTGVDITQEIPFKYWLVFIIAMAVILPLANKMLTHLFIPKSDDEEAPVWSSMSKKGKGKKF